MENVNLSFRTKDFYHAVVLKALGFKLLGLDRAEGGFSIFVFNDDGQKAEDAIRKYWERVLKVDPRAMVNSINELKTRLYSN